MRIRNGTIRNVIGIFFVVLMNRVANVLVAGYSADIGYSLDLPEDIIVGIVSIHVLLDNWDLRVSLDSVDSEIIVIAIEIKVVKIIIFNVIGNIVVMV